MRVALVGLGKISAAHRSALERFPDIEAVVGMDLDRSRQVRFRGEDIPVYSTLDRMLRHDPNVIIVATPTQTHSSVCLEAMALAGSTRIVVEKPLSTRLSEVHQLLERSAARAASLDVIYHAAYAPEVLWAAKRMQEWTARLGPVVSIESFFSDPYGDLHENLRKYVYGTSWLDSGINALSVLARLVTLVEVREIHATDESSSVYRAELRFSSDSSPGNGRITTSWSVESPAKHTTMCMQSGAELHLNHQEIKGVLQYQGEDAERFEYQGEMPRLVAHYYNAFNALLSSGEGPFDLEDHHRLHRLLLESYHPGPRLG